MTKPQQRKLVEATNASKDYLQAQPGFAEDEKLKAAFVAICAVEAAVMFGETPSLARVCADWCDAVVKGTAEGN
jgi:hypothetical protein